MTVAELHAVFQQDEDHYAELQCEHFSAFLENDLHALGKIELQERTWQTALKRKEICFDFEFEREITRRYKKWLETAEVRLEQIKMQRELGCAPGIAEEFERHVDDTKEAYVMRVRSETAALARYETLHETG
jgi:hypothetical protein